MAHAADVTRRDQGAVFFHGPILTSNSPTISSSRPRVALIDGNYFAHRFYHGRPAQRGKDGREVGVLSAYALWLAQLASDKRLSHWALVLDHQDPSFRHQAFADYKGHRPPMPDDLREQLRLLPELASIFGISTWQISGVEADDTLASLAQRSIEAGAEVWLATSDKDLDQLLTQQLFTWDPMGDRLRGVSELWNERGIRPDQVCDWLCMVGDSADNIPGIKGIGVKGAAQLLGEYDNLSAIIAHRETFTRVGNKPAKNSSLANNSFVISWRCVLMLTSINQQSHLLSANLQNPIRLPRLKFAMP